ncbi:MAG: PAS domain-containing protein [Sphingomonadaceae bacterium]
MPHIRKFLRPEAPTAKAGHSRFAPYGIDVLEDDPELAAICGFAAELCDAPTAVVSLVERERQRFLARSGTDARETPRSTSFCALAMLESGLTVVPDAAQDPRFAHFALVTQPPHIRFYAGAPLVSPEGEPLGTLCVIDYQPRPAGLSPLQQQGLEVMAQAVMRRLGHRREGLARETEMAETARRFAMVADGIPDIAWSCTSALEFDFYNARWQEFTGAEPPQDTDGWRPLVHPDDEIETFGHWAVAVRTGEPFQSTYRMRHASGAWRWVLSRAVPLQDAEGQIERWFGTVTDIEEQRALSEQRDLLARELSHRIKNIFAVIASLVALRSRQHPEAAPFAEDLAETIAALGRAHDYVRPLGGRHGDRLVGLLRDLLCPYDEQGAGRVTFAGDDCPLGERAATPLALVFHELATNSAKYGALSSRSGQVSVTTTLDHAAGTMQIDWLEQGGPPPQPGGEEGFGSRLVKLAVEGQLRGTITRQWLGDGVAVTVTAPLAAIG